MFPVPKLPVSMCAVSTRAVSTRAVWTRAVSMPPVPVLARRLPAVGAMLAITVLLIASPAASSRAIAASPAAADPSGTSWHLAGLDNTALSDEQRAANATLTLNRANGDGGQVVGNTGCNRFFGSYRSHGDRLLFSGLGAAKMACEDVRMRLEQRFLDVLARTARQQRGGDRLRLLDSHGAVLATFEAAKPRR